MSPRVDPERALERYERAVNKQDTVTKQLEVLVERLEQVAEEESREIRETPLRHDVAVDEEQDGE